MTEDEAEKYWRPARAKMPLGLGDHKNSVGQSRKLAKLLGLDYPTNQHYFNIPLTPDLQLNQHYFNIPITPDLKLKLQMLAGPHHETIIKIMELKKTAAKQEF